MRGTRTAAVGTGLALALASIVSGCIDDLPKATEIARMRILGAELSVTTDPTRTTPKPGETVRVSLSTQFPSLEDDRSAVQSLIITCTAPDRFTGGIPICQELIDVATAPGASAGDVQLPDGFDERFPCDGTFAFPVLDPVSPIGLQCRKGEQTFELGIPPQYAADELLFVGIVCERGAAVIDPALPGLFGCEDASAEPIPFHGLVRVQHSPADENHNPDLSQLHMVREITGQWEPAEPSSETLEAEQACGVLVDDDPDDPALPWVIGGLTLNFSYPASARERVDGEPEELEFTVYATDGDIERRFTLFDPSDEGRKILDSHGDPLRDADGNEIRELHDTIHWESPKVADLPDDGLLVRFFVTVRDGRGGYAQADYALCALKQEP